MIAAPNTFKGSLGAIQAARAMERGIHDADPKIRVKKIPVSDGGDGLVDALADAMGGAPIHLKVNDPRQRPIEAKFLFNPNQSTAVIEMALASGLALLPEDLRNPERTNTFGTGELIREAMDRGGAHIIMGIGGSATCDGGIGAASALGYRFLDKYGTRLDPVGESLIHVAAIDKKGVDPRIADTRFSIACDVTNPLTGPNGASFVFSPQKGATPAQVKALDRGLDNLARIIARDLGLEIKDLDGAGAAGGLGGGMKAFFNADLTPGIDLVLDYLDFQNQIKGADLVLTAEGRVDSQTEFNKAPVGVAGAALAERIPCFALCGSMGCKLENLYDLGMDAVFSLCKGPMTLDRAMADAFDLLRTSTEQVVRAFIAGRKAQNE